MEAHAPPYPRGDASVPTPLSHKAYGKHTLSHKAYGKHTLSHKAYGKHIPLS